MTRKDATKGLTPPFLMSIWPLGRAGFTLVEMMIVASVLAIVVAIAIPALIRSRMQANESATQSNLRTISSAAEAYRTNQDQPVYPPTFNTLIQADPPYLDSAWLASERQGYRYAYASASSGGTYAVSATPDVPDVTGVNTYCVDQTGIIRRYNGGGDPARSTGCDSQGTPI